MKEEFTPGEETNTTPVQPEVNAQPSEPVQPYTATTVQQQVEPVVQEQQVPLQSVGEEQPKKKSIVPVILIIIFLLIIAGCLVYYFFLKDKVSLPGNNNTTTTQATSETTTTQAPTGKLLDIKSIDDYKKIVTDSGFNPDNNYSGVILLDDSFYELDFDMENKCKNDGDKVSFNIKNSKIEYTCKLDNNICDEDAECNVSEKEWVANITVNDKYKLEYGTYVTCGNSIYFTNGKYYLDTFLGCAVGMSRMNIMTESNESIAKGSFEFYYYKTKDDDRKENATPIIIKDNIAYYIVADNPENDGETTCRVKYVDFNQDKVELKDMNVSGSCYHYGE